MLSEKRTITGPKVRKHLGSLYSSKVAFRALLHSQSQLSGFINTVCQRKVKRQNDGRSHVVGNACGSSSLLKFT